MIIRRSLRTSAHTTPAQLGTRALSAARCCLRHALDVRSFARNTHFVAPNRNWRGAIKTNDKSVFIHICTQRCTVYVAMAMPIR